MGDYNADKEPDLLGARIITTLYNFGHTSTTYIDQWTIDPTHRVISVVPIPRRGRIKFLLDPTKLNVPG